MKVAVIGGGVMGLATGWALKRRGHEPVVYEQFEVGNPHGSSHGRSRIFRLAYAEDEYVRLAQEALGLWRELEAESGETVLELYGLVEIVSSLEESTAETLERCGVAWERLDREEAERRFPIRVPSARSSSCRRRRESRAPTRSVFRPALRQRDCRGPRLGTADSTCFPPSTYPGPSSSSSRSDRDSSSSSTTPRADDDRSSASSSWWAWPRAFGRPSRLEAINEGSLPSELLAAVGWAG